MSKIEVPFKRLAVQSIEIKQDLLRAFESVVDSGHYILGPNLKAFEEAFAALCGSRYAIGVANGTDALHLVWRALGVGPGDEVITAPNSFIASASSIALAGATPVFADIRPDLNIDPERVEAAITPRTKGIVPVHLTGRPAAMVEILRIAEKHGLFVLEDACQAVGASLNGRPMGSWGNAAAFSLHPLKNLFVYGDGGAITTNDSALRDKLLLARNHGLVNRERCDFWSYNSRLDELQAALILVQMKVLGEWNQARREMAQYYDRLLKPYVQVPSDGPGEVCVYQTYVIQADDRDALQQYLLDNGVEAPVHYRAPIHVQPAAASLGYQAEDFPQTMRACSRILSLPLYPGMPRSHQDTVAGLIQNFYEKRPQAHAEATKA